MGQAVVDLPDPLNSPEPADGTSADDLLSKLAGDEIDRLLAESDNGKMPETEPGPQPEPAPAPAVEEAAVPAPVEAVPGVVAICAADIDLDDVLNSAEADRAALVEDPIIEDALSPQIDLGDNIRPASWLSLLLKPLVWFSAPLDPWPDQLRDVLGKIGVMTLINAAAVIAYVLLFRRHH